MQPQAQAHPISAGGGNASEDWATAVFLAKGNGSRLRAAPLANGGRQSRAGIRNLASGRRTFLREGEIRPVFPEARGMVCRYRCGSRAGAVTAGTADGRGVAGQ